MICYKPRIYTPKDKALQAPNSDTSYSMIGLVLRAEPMVLPAPKMVEGTVFQHPAD
jgi:hypothetical protein